MRINVNLEVLVNLHWTSETELALLVEQIPAYFRQKTYFWY